MGTKSETEFASKVIINNRKKNLNNFFSTTNL